jgi:hypothetical protein
MASANIVQKLWNYCNVLRDDGMSYGLPIAFEHVSTYGVDR